MNIGKSDWQKALQESYTSLSQLVEAGFLDPSLAQRLGGEQACQTVQVSRYYAGLIDLRDPNCPIRKQAIPSLAERDPSSFPPRVIQQCRVLYQRETPWDSDPIGDLARQVVPRLTHRYPHRALLHLSALCTTFCRFCFRKNQLMDAESQLYDGSYDAAWGYLREHSEVQELILTGGDPLTRTDAFWERLLGQVAQIHSLKVLRIHSRVGVTLPLRWTEDLLKLFKRDRSFRIVLVHHFNHPRELSGFAREGLRKLNQTGLVQMNQSVLLRGVNDVFEVLRDLFSELYAEGVIPLYLHHPDWTPNTFGFRGSIAEGKALVKRLRGVLSGPALPDYVLDLPGGYGKVSLLGEGVKLLESEVLEQEGRVFQMAIYEMRSPVTRPFPASSELQKYLDLSEVQPSATNYC